MAAGSILPTPALGPDDTGAPYRDYLNRMRREEQDQGWLSQVGASAPAPMAAQYPAQTPAANAASFSRWRRVPMQTSPVLDDIGTGIAEAPRAGVRGLVEAAANLIHTGNEFEAWLGTLSPEQIAQLPAPLQLGAAGAKLMPKNWLAAW